MKLELENLIIITAIVIITILILIITRKLKINEIVKITIKETAIKGHYVGEPQIQ